MVEINGRKFEITEPSTGVLLRLLNVVGKVGLRAEREVSDAIKALGSGGSTSGLMLMAVLAELSEDDLLKFGAAVLQFESEREGVKWLRENGLPLPALLEAAVLNFEKSQGLLEVLSGFLERVTGIVTTAIPQTQAKE